MFEYGGAFGGVGWRRPWWVVLGVVLLVWGWIGVSPCQAGESCSDAGLGSGTTYYGWDFVCQACTRDAYSKYVQVMGDVVQASGINPGACWGGGVTSWRVVVNLINNTTQGESAGDPAQPSYLELTQYRIKLVNGSGDVVHTETVSPGQMNTWFSHPDSDYGDSMAWLEPEQNGAG